MSKDGTVQLWDTVTGDYWRLLEGDSDEIQAAIISPDGQKAAVLFGDYRIKLYNMANQDHRLLVGHSSFVTAVAFSPDGELVASASMDSTLRIWEIEGHCSVSEGCYDWVQDIVLSRDGQLVASRHESGTVRLYSTAGQRYTVSLENCQNDFFWNGILAGLKTGCYGIIQDNEAMGDSNGPVSLGAISGFSEFLTLWYDILAKWSDNPHWRRRYHFAIASQVCSYYPSNT